MLAYTIRRACQGLSRVVRPTLVASIIAPAALTLSIITAHRQFFYERESVVISLLDFNSRGEGDSCSVTLEFAVSNVGTESAILRDALVQWEIDSGAGQTTSGGGQEMAGLPLLVKPGDLHIVATVLPNANPEYFYKEMSELITDPEVVFKHASFEGQELLRRVHVSISATTIDGKAMEHRWSGRVVSALVGPGIVHQIGTGSRIVQRPDWRGARGEACRVDLIDGE